MDRQINTASAGPREGHGVRRPRPRQGRGLNSCIQILKPYSLSSISKLTRRKVENWPASPRRSSTFLAFFPSFHHDAEMRQGATPHSDRDHDSRVRITRRHPTHTRCHMEPVRRRRAAPPRRAGLPENGARRRQPGRAPPPRR